MPESPKPVRLTTKHTPPPRLSTSERGYDRTHQRQRTLWLAEHPLCQRCGREWSVHLHHKDRNPHNKAPENLEALGLKCHQEEHGSDR